MQTEELILDDSSQRQEIEELSETLPNIGISVFSAALVIKSINLSNLARLVVSPQNGDPVFVPDFECEKQSDSFYAVVA